MNKAEVILKVSEKSGINEDDCKKILNAFEEVLSDRLSDSKGVSVFETVYKIMSFIKSKKENKVQSTITSKN